MIAVTGSYGVGTSVLYVIDTHTRQLAVYEARGGSPDSAKLFLVGARRIDLELDVAELGLEGAGEAGVVFGHQAPALPTRI